MPVQIGPWEGPGQPRSAPQSKLDDIYRSIKVVETFCHTLMDYKARPTLRLSSGVPILKFIDIKHRIIWYKIPGIIAQFTSFWKLWDQVLCKSRSCQKTIQI